MATSIPPVPTRRITATAFALLALTGCPDAEVGPGATPESPFAPRGVAANGNGADFGNRSAGLPGIAPVADDRPRHATESPALRPALPDGVDVRVTRVTDGDTVHIEYEGRDERLRYIGVNTPETAHSPRGLEPYGNEATELNASLVGGQTVRLVLGRDPRDRYDRLLGYVYLQDGTFVNAALVERGYARVMTVRPNNEFEPLFRRLENEARTARRGLWSR